jgi:hypothetical protein
MEGVLLATLLENFKSNLGNSRALFSGNVRAHVADGPTKRVRIRNAVKAVTIFEVPEICAGTFVAASP